MLKSKLRLLGVSALVGAGLIAAGPADAYNVRLGGVDVQIDTSVSLGMSYKMKDTNSHHLSLGNGGNVDNRPVVSLLGAAGAIQGGTVPSAAVQADGVNLGTASNKSATCGVAYTTVCLTLGDTEAGALNGIHQQVVGTTAYLTAIAGGDNPNEAAVDQAAALAAIPAADLAAGGPINYDSSINGDDGRLNFEKGDLVSAPFKFLTEIEARMGNVRGFLRLNGFYDAVLDDDGSFARSDGLLEDAKRDAIENIQVLDAFVDIDTNIGDIPVLVRVGNQVINWGESTFFLGGNSVFNPIDVPAIRRPGAEIKDALLPVEAAYVSASLTQDITLEAYVGGHDGFKLDVGGTHFANSDNLVVGSGKGGNNGVFLVGGSPTSGSNKLNNDSTGVATIAAATGILQGTERIQAEIAADADHIWNGGTTSDAQHFNNGAPVGTIESFREGWEDTSRIGNFEKDADGDNYGLAVRYYAENLNSTEFGFYYQNYQSRIPYVGYRAYKPTIGISTTGGTASATTLSLQGTSACDRATFGGASFGPHAAALTNAVANGITIGGDAGDDINDPYEAWAVVKAAAQDTFTALSAVKVHRSYHTAAAGAISGFLQTADGAAALGLSAALPEAQADSAGQYYATVVAARGIDADMPEFGDTAGVNALTGAQAAAIAGATFTDAVANGRSLGAVAGTILGALLEAETIDQATYNDWTNAANATTGVKPWEAADFTDDTITGAVWFANAGIANPAGDTFMDLLNAQCLLGIDNRLADGATDDDWYGDYGINGAMQAGLNWTTDLYLYYPEVEVYGASFNTTLLGWGVQGEITSRPDMPLLVDTDSTFIAAAVSQCALGLLGDAGMAAYGPLVTRAGYYCDETVGQEDLDGHVNLDVYNWDIGTTATYTRSNPVVSALRADLGILLTEFGGVSVPDIDTTYFGAKGASQVVDRLQGICTGGSDLPLGGLLDLDAVPVNSCRPTENSYGGLVLASLQYNNVFGTPWGLTPTVIVREGFHGYSPSPAGSFREGVGSTSFSLRASLQGYLDVAVSYTDFTGEQKYTKAEDQDFASISVNYAF